MENSRLSSLALSGNLYTEIEDGGLQSTGNIEDSRLKGSLLVSNSDQVVGYGWTPDSAHLVFGIVLGWHCRRRLTLLRSYSGAALIGARSRTQGESR